MPATKPKVRVINGHKVTLYYVGELANRVNRTATLVRHWETIGVIPATWFHDEKGRRMYTEEMIDLIVQSLKESPIGTGKPVKNSDFSALCHEGFERLHKKYFGR